MAISLPDARQLSDEVLQALRLRALRGCELGFTEADVADMLGVSPETVSRWWSAYASGGLEAVPGDRTGRPVGSGRTLSDDQSRHIRGRIDDHSPEESGIAAPLWSRRAVRELIRQELGIRMPVRTVGEYLRRWGYTAKRPRRRARKQDPEEVRRWLEETYPAIEGRAQEGGAEIPWCDETGVAADEHPRCGYAREGHPAMMEVPDRHIRMNSISAISDEGTVRFMTSKGTTDAASSLVFLGRLLRTSTRKTFLIVDHLRAHEKGTVAGWVEAHKDRIEVSYLPCYAPELNPGEYLNNDLKGGVNEAGLPNSKKL
jgi:transposase